MFTTSNNPVEHRPWIQAADAIFFALLLMIGFALYSSNIATPYYYDDVYNIEFNTAVHDMHNFPKFFTDPRTHNSLPQNSPYRPLCTLIYAILWWIGSGATWPFHVFKIFSHALVAWLAFRISREIFSLDPFVLAREQKDKQKFPDFSTFIAGAGALLFMVHPGLSETVNYISSTSTLLCSLFFLVAFWFFLKGKLGLMSVFYLLSAVTKEEGAVFPLAILAFYWIFGARSPKLALRSVAASFAVFAVYLGLYLGERTDAVIFSDVSRLTYFLTQIRAWVFYILWIFWPWDYSIEHMEFGFSDKLWDPKVLLSALTVAGVLIAVFRLRRSQNLKTASLFPLFGITWYFVCLLPASSLFPLAEPINEHRYYLSYALLFPTLTYLAARIWVSWVQPRFSFEKIRWIPLVLAALLALRTVSENQVWSTPVSLWENVVKIDPANGRARNNLGVQYLKRGEIERALEQFLTCAQFSTYPFCFASLGDTWTRLNQLAKAEEAYQRGVELSPTGVVTLYYYARHLLRSMKQPEKALIYTARCDAAARGTYLDCILLSSEILRTMKRPAQAAEFARRAVALAPRSREAVFELGMDLVDAGKYDEALAAFNGLLRENPKDAQALHNAGWLLLQKGDLKNAQKMFFEKLAVLPKDVTAWLNLRTIAQKTGDATLAEQAKRALAEINPAMYH